MQTKYHLSRQEGVVETPWLHPHLPEISPSIVCSLCIVTVCFPCSFHSPINTSSCSHRNQYFLNCPPLQLLHLFMFDFEKYFVFQSKGPTLMSVCDKVSYFPQRETGNFRSSILVLGLHFDSLFPLHPAARLH